MSFKNALLIAAAVVGLASTAHAQTNGTITIGVPVGLSGANSIVAPSVVQAAQLAVAQINAAGGVLGRKLVLDVADDESGAAGAQKAFDYLVYQKNVDVVIGLETSAARNAGLPITEKGGVPYIYTSFYEGHACSPNLFVDGWVPEQQVPPVADYFLKTLHAKKFFLIGSDYAFGRGMLDFAKAYIEKAGGSVVGEQFLPIDGTDWTSIICQSQEFRRRCHHHLDRRRRAERHADQAASPGRRHASLCQPRARRRYREKHGNRCRRHLYCRLLSDQHPERRQQGVSRRDDQAVRFRAAYPQRPLGPGV